jgi:hypothetical protein
LMSFQRVFTHPHMTHCPGVIVSGIQGVLLEIQVVWTD